MLNTDTQALFEQAMRLPAETREVLAAELLRSVEPDEKLAADVRDAWNNEIELRMSKLESGEHSPVPIQEVWPKLTGKPWEGASGADA